MPILNAWEPFQHYDCNSRSRLRSCLKISRGYKGGQPSRKKLSRSSLTGHDRGRGSNPAPGRGARTGRAIEKFFSVLMLARFVRFVRGRSGKEVSIKYKVL